MKNRLQAWPKLSQIDKSGRGEENEPYAVEKEAELGTFWTQRQLRYISNFIKMVGTQNYDSFNDNNFNILVVDKIVLRIVGYITPKEVTDKIPVMEMHGSLH